MGMLVDSLVKIHSNVHVNSVVAATTTIRSVPLTIYICLTSTFTASYALPCTSFTEWKYEITWKYFCKQLLVFITCVNTILQKIWINQIKVYYSWYLIFLSHVPYYFHILFLTFIISKKCTYTLYSLLNVIVQFLFSWESIINLVPTSFTFAF